MHAGKKEEEEEDKGETGRTGEKGVNYGLLLPSPLSSLLRNTPLSARDGVNGGKRDERGGREGVGKKEVSRSGEKEKVFYVEKKSASPVFSRGGVDAKKKSYFPFLRCSVFVRDR